MWILTCPRRVVVVVLALCVAPHSRAADEVKLTPAEVFARDVDAYREKLPTLEPQAAAGQWLALYDREGKLPRPVPTDEGEDDFEYTMPAEPPIEKLLKALPPPAAWGALAEAVEKRPRPQQPRRRDTGLRLLAAALTGSRPAEQDLAALDDLPQPLVPPNEYSHFDAELAAENNQQLRDAFAPAPAGPDEVLRRTEARIAAQTTEHISQLRLPDLVTLVGPGRAADTVLRALRSPAPVSVPAGGKTLDLARKLALEHMAELRVPHWDLVGPAEDSIALYEALSRRFPPIDPNAPAGGKTLWSRILGSRKEMPRARLYDQYNRARARSNYAVALLLAGRTEDAAAQLRDATSRDTVGGMHTVVNALTQNGRDAAVFDVLDKLLAGDPHLPLWQPYRAVAARLGRSGRMLERAREAAGREGLSEAERAAVRTALYKALLAADKPDEAADVIRDLIKAAPAEPGAEEDASRGRLGIELATLGRLLGDDEWVEEGLRVARGALSKIWEDAAADPDADYTGQYESRQLGSEVADLLLALGRGPDAVGLLADGAVRARQRREREAAALGQGGWQEVPSQYDREEAREPLVQLVSIYHRAGKHADVLTLFDTLAEWGARDLAEIYDAEDGAGNPLGLIAAAALADAGRTDEARKLLDPVLDAKPELDPAYELLVKLNGGAAGADATVRRLDALYARDPFEERPLIWKAHVLHLAGKNEEAEKVAKQAIAIDPSDGEQGRGRRMRVYAVLADVLEAKGDAEQARFFRDVVKAIRLAERADEFYSAGLLSRGVAMYREALGLFADAYCIQSRLAVQLAEMGRIDEAAEHYRKAFELMPDSFGRVESHCFGCEGAFRGDAAQGIAERVFGKLLEAQPQRPQVHYLVAYLRRNQGRQADALPPLRTAVKLDPDYLNAWKEIVTLADVLGLPAAERDEALLNVLRLDPLRRHTSPGLTKVRDLKSLWATVEAAQPLRPEKPAALYPLKAGAAEMDKQAAAAEEAAKVAREQAAQLGRMNPGFIHNPVSHSFGTDEDEERLPTPGEAVARTNLVQLIKGVITGDPFTVDELEE